MRQNRILPRRGRSIDSVTMMGRLGRVGAYPGDDEDEEDKDGRDELENGVGDHRLSSIAIKVDGESYESEDEDAERHVAELVAERLKGCSGCVASLDDGGGADGIGLMCGVDGSIVARRERNEPGGKTIDDVLLTDDKLLHGLGVGHLKGETTDDLLERLTRLSVEADGDGLACGDAVALTSGGRCRAVAQVGRLYAQGVGDGEVQGVGDGDTKGVSNGGVRLGAYATGGAAGGKDECDEDGKEDGAHNGGK